MNDTTTTETAPQTTTENPDTEKKFTVDDLARTYFAPDDVATKGAEYLAQVLSLENLPHRLNFDPEQTFPEGMGLYILPLTKRSEVKGEGRKVLGVAISAVPSLELLAGLGDRGRDFLESAITSAYATKIASSLKPDEKGNLPDGANLPKSVEDFIESRREISTYGYFSEFAKKYVPELKKKIPFLTAVILRQIFQSKAYAADFKSVKDEFWTKLLDLAISKGNAEHKDVSQLVNWKDTREQNVIDVTQDIDLDELAELVEAA